MSFDPGGFGPPVQYNAKGDVTPFRTNERGDIVPFVTNARGDIVPFELANVVNGNLTPFAFDDAGNRIPNVNELFPSPTQWGPAFRPQPRATDGTASSANLVAAAFLLL